MMNKYGFTDKEWNDTLTIFKKCPEIKKVVLFGSRAKNTFKPMSDVDIVLYGEKTNHSVIASLQSHFEDSQIPYFFDIIDYKAISSNELKEHIRQYGKTILGGDIKTPKVEAVGLPNGWIETTLGEVAEVQMGPFVSQLHSEDYVDVGTPIITVEHIVDDRIHHAVDIPKVSDEDKQRLTNYILKKGDIVFSRVGCVDKSAYVSNKEDGWIFSGRLLRVRGDRLKTYPHYLHYSLTAKNTKLYIQKISVGSTMPSINTAILSKIRLILPSLPEQKGIAAVLSAFDDKIELLREQSKTLETLAQTIFKEWFVYFNYPDKNANPYRDNGVEMLDSKLGEIPKGKYNIFVVSIFEKIKNNTSQIQTLSKSRDTLLPKLMSGKIRVKGFEKKY